MKNEKYMDFAEKQIKLWKNNFKSKSIFYNKNEHLKPIEYKNI